MYKMQPKKKEKRIGVKITHEQVMLGVAMLVVFIAALWHLEDNYSLKIWGDEFGYWQGAAYLAGKDWSSIASTNVYYGYGYGILLFPILFFWGHDPVAMVQISLVVEAVMLVSCVVAAYLCIGYFSERLVGMTKILVATLAVLYPSNILYANMTLSEILLTTLFWWYTYLVLRFINNPSKPMGIAIALILIAVYMYTVHQRTLVVMGITLLLIGWSYQKRPFHIRFLIVVGILVIGLLSVFLFKKAYVASMYAQVEEATYNVNNMAGQTSKIMRIVTSLEGFREFVISLVGKFYYVSVASFYLVVLGLIYCVKTVVHLLKEKGDQNRVMAMLIIFLNFMSIYFVDAIYTLEGYYSRTDMLLYGRYMEYVFGPLIVLGVIWLYEYGSSKVLLALMGLVASAGLMAGKVIPPTASNGSVWIQTSAVADLFQSNQFMYGEGIYVAMFRSSLFVLLLYAATYIRKYIKDVGVMLACVCICCVWISIGYKAWQEVSPWANELYDRQMEVLSYIDEDRYGLYQSYMDGFFQFLQPDAKIISFKNLEQIASEQEPLYIITYVQAEDADKIKQEEEIIFENKRYFVWRSSAN
ncbi:MAG: hypothetical protein K2O32_00440 [Acetatifactor sp.]|nr:hypothetical protein [Acetatifactor sp.]